MKNHNKEQSILQSALEKLTLEETVALTREFERILTTGDIEKVNKQETKKRKRAPADRYGRTLKLGQVVETTADGRRVRGCVKGIGKRVSIEPKNRPIIVRAFHNVRVIEKREG